jgi:hypothetical protein
MSKQWLRRLAILPVLAIAWSMHGCAQIGAVWSVIAHAFPKHVDAVYKGLPHQTVVVLVWVDRGIRADYPDLQTNLASGIQNKFIQVQAADHPAELEKTTFPIFTNTVIEDQEKHPELEQYSLTDLAKRYDCTRLIVVSVSDYTVHSTMSPELFRGKMTVDVNLVEVYPDKTHPEDPKLALAKLIPIDSDLSVLYPKDSPTDGLPIGTESSISEGTLKMMVEKVCQKFYNHDEEQD